MRCVGWTAKGERIQLPAPVRLRLRSDEDAPADSLEARFPAWDAVGNLCWIQLMDRVGRVLFAGIVETAMVGSVIRQSSLCHCVSCCSRSFRFHCPHQHECLKIHAALCCNLVI